jgi:glutaredoxin 3
MPKITIYTTPICPYCVRAKALLRKKGANFDEVDVFMDSIARDQMESRANGQRTVPQIFIGDRHVGGCDELYSLERAGELDPLLSAA